jgi:hypothetical protein
MGFFFCDSLFGGNVTFRFTAHWHSRFMNALLCAASIPVLAVPRQPLADAQQAPGRPFTVADEIGLANFGDPYNGETEPIIVSPDGRLVAVHVERGLLDKNRVEDELRVYSMAVLRTYVLRADQKQMPVPLWSVRESTYREGPLITNIRWLRNSHALAFLLKTPQGKRQLVLSNLKRSQLQPLSANGQDVTAFDVRDVTHFVYTVRALSGGQNPGLRHNPAVTIASGQSLGDLFFHDEFTRGDAVDRSILWAADGTNVRIVLNPNDHQPIVIYREGQYSLALSPDGKTLATALPVPDIPKTWESLYPAPYAGFPYGVRVGRQDLTASYGHKLVSEYATVNLSTGKVKSVTGAPTAYGAGWWAAALASPAWSNDGKALLLPGTFLQATAPDHSVIRPCAAIFDLSAYTATCLVPLRSGYTHEGGPESGFFSVKALSFADGTDSKVVLHLTRSDHSNGILVYSQLLGSWQAAPEQTSIEPILRAVEVSVKEGLNTPPVLLAADPETKASRVIWEPNPQLKKVTLGEASVYHWQDTTGRAWIGGLFKPWDYTPGRRYPLVIQTHGFNEEQFRPSGIYPTAFAARALAAAGMVVLQVKDCSVRGIPLEGSCQVAGYEAAVKSLASEGFIDPKRIGIIGFSRTVYYALEALISNDLNFTAASVTDGVDEGYWQYLMTVDLMQNSSANEADAMIGAKPFGAGLQRWLERSPEFNMQKVHTPLLVVGEGPFSLLSMWGPYAALRYLGKPVDLQMLNTDEHVLTNPAVRMASQGGSVDWFRFWLQDYEDPDSDKKEQYKRWEHLRELRDADAKAAGQAQDNTSKPN